MTTIDALDLSFSPANVTVRAGDSVRWRNISGLHNVVSSDSTLRCAAGCDNTGGDGTPSTTAWTVTMAMSTPGVYRYFCEVHEDAGMVATVTVQ